MVFATMNVSMKLASGISVIATAQLAAHNICKMMDFAMTSATWLNVNMMETTAFALKDAS